MVKEEELLEKGIEALMKSLGEVDAERSLRCIS